MEFASGPRNRAIILVFSSSSARVGGLDGLKWRDIDPFYLVDKNLKTSSHYCIFVSDDSPVSNLIGILNLLLGEITVWGADAADVTTRRREE